MKLGSPFRHSALDTITLVLAALQIGGYFAGVLLFATLPAWALLALACALMVLMFLNVNGLGHTLVHGGVFRDPALNALTGMANSLALGIPQTLYQAHHLNHHVGNSDRKQPGGATRDWSSIYRYSRSDGPENVVTYSLLNLLRGDSHAMLRDVRRRGRVRHLGWEAAGLGAWLVLLGLIDTRALCCFYLPTFYLGWALSGADAYYKHWGVEPDDRFANSVSSYGRIYNWLAFNTGYHQEHHLRPGAHWTLLPEIRRAFESDMLAHGTRRIRCPHVLSFLEPPTRSGAPVLASSQRAIRSPEDLADRSDSAGAAR